MSKTATVKTPVELYHDAKQAEPACLVLVRSGDFYEAFYEDARTIARELGLCLTTRKQGADVMPMAGFPYHQLDAYLAKIVANGHRAAIVDPAKSH